MYGGSLVFFFYMYIVLLLNPRWYSTWQYMGKLFGVCLPRPKTTPSTDSLSSAAATIRKVTHSSPAAGSLFLRLGSVVFGVIGVVYYAFLVFLCRLDENCSPLSSSLDVCAMFFIFIQMHFIFCNWKISITGSHMVARIGTMHLVAANLWTWIRYVLMEEGVMEKEIREVFNNRPSSHSPDNNSMTSSSSAESGELFESSHEVVAHGEKIMEGSCKAAECILGSLSEIMFTSIVEYSLIAAAVMYIVWRNIGLQDNGSIYVKRKHQIRVDCSKTTTGLFLGLAFLAVTFTSMIIYYGFSMKNDPNKAAYVYAFTDMFQVGTQTFLLHVARSVRMGCEDREAQPGKQAITFLLTANLAIFFMNLFESEKAGVSEIIIEYYGKRSWVFLVRSFSPLTIFYRFHSSVCFAEIWKNVYAAKSHTVHTSATSTSLATPISI
uniref:Uncharacterized protein n=1 Tax=Caenorhabditis japonica TaxID=281687 RepID=A0A8R1DNW1_CAEJA